jgi:hypothetical protein
MAVKLCLFIIGKSKFSEFYNNCKGLRSIESLRKCNGTPTNADQTNCAPIFQELKFNDPRGFAQKPPARKSARAAVEPRRFGWSIKISEN